MAYLLWIGGARAIYAAGKIRTILERLLSMRLGFFLRGWSVQRRCLMALLVRDIMMKYGREHLGFVWLILEPMLLTIGVLILWSVLKGGYEHGLRIVELVLTGYMLLTLWRHVTTSPVLLLRRSTAIFYHQKVSHFDVFFSRIVLEFGGTTAALVIVTLTLFLMGIIDPTIDWALFIGGWLAMAGLASGAGAIILAATELNETMERFIQPIQYLLVPISGVFFLVEWLPSDAQRLVLLNPLVHCYEMFRAGFFNNNIETHFSVPYVLAWIFILNFLGMMFIEKVRNNFQPI
ncbi:sugar ABC transporter permease [Candidatus Saccharibacteria bacterium]|nr:sugar ABC transporter permease [Candidatus Saccharibacteria bacterium]